MNGFNDSLTAISDALKSLDIKPLNYKGQELSSFTLTMAAAALKKFTEENNVDKINKQF